jgi:hypothetical protein
MVILSLVRPPASRSFDWHILAEGDSWFHFGFAPRPGKPRNLLDPLKFEKSTVIVSFALSGDTIKHISKPGSNPELLQAMAYRKWNLILLSAGGNDLIDALVGDGNYKIGGQPIAILKPAPAGSHFMEYINLDALQLLLDFIDLYYHRFAALRESEGGRINRDTRIVTHCYDYITARNAPAVFGPLKLGPWAYEAFTNPKYNIPNDQNQWKFVTEYLFERLAERLQRLATSSIPNMTVINTLDTLNPAKPGTTGRSGDWANEIHPTPDGYAKLADQKISPALASLLS